MNLLSHLHLSEGLPAQAAAGNVLADYLRRAGVVLTETPPSFQKGVRLHRAIDTFTDTHPVVLEARTLVSPARRRLAGIVLDIAFDLFLTRHWERFCGAKRDRQAFIRESYGVLHAAAEPVSSQLAGYVRWMREVDLLGSYTGMDGLALAYQRVSRRSPVAAPLAGAEEEVARHHAAFEQAFLDFYPRLMETVADFLAEPARSGTARRHA